MCTNLRIAFGCQSRVGKSTAVKYLIENYGGVEKSFASPLYDIMYYAQETCGFEKVKNREFLQTIGTWARVQNPNVWINLQIKGLKTINPEENVYFSDVRFNNEFEALKNEGFIMVRIIQDGNCHDIGGGSLTHESEIELISKPLVDWNYIIKNNGSLDDFYLSLDALVRNIET